MKSGTLLNIAAPTAPQPQALLGQVGSVAPVAGDFALTLAMLPTTDAAVAVPVEASAPVAAPTGAKPIEAVQAERAGDAQALVDASALAALGLLPMQPPMQVPIQPLIVDRPRSIPLPSQAQPCSAAPQGGTSNEAQMTSSLPPILPVTLGTSATTAEPASSELQQLIERLSAQPSDLGGMPVANNAGLNVKAGAASADGNVPLLSLKGEPRQWQQPLMQALGDRLQVQSAGRSEQAVIRLDPPLLGQVEIAIRQQAGELQVRLSASHGEVARQLHQISDGLRQDLVQRHSGEVTVLVTQSTRAADEPRQAGREPQSQQQQHAQDQREQQQQRRPGRGLGDATMAGKDFSSSLNADHGLA